MGKKWKVLACWVKRWFIPAPRISLFSSPYLGGSLASNRDRNSPKRMPNKWWKFRVDRFSCSRLVKYTRILCPSISVVFFSFLGSITVRPVKVLQPVPESSGENFESVTWVDTFQSYGRTYRQIDKQTQPIQNRFSRIQIVRMDRLCRMKSRSSAFELTILAVRCT